VVGALDMKWVDALSKKHSICSVLIGSRNTRNIEELLIHVT